MTKNIENIRETNKPASNIESEIRRLSPWLFRFTINGIETGGDYPLADDPKPHLFAQEMPRQFWNLVPVRDMSVSIWRSE